MRHPAYLGEDSGSQAIAGEFSRILAQFWSNPKIVNQTVSHWLSASPNPLLHTQLELEARVGIEAPFIVEKDYIPDKHESWNDSEVSGMSYPLPMTRG